MITSSANPTIKSIRALRSRKERSETGLLFAEGTRLVAEALDSGMEIQTLVAAEERIRSPYAQELVERAAARGIPCLWVSEKIYDGLAESEGRQGLAAVVRQHWTPLEEARPAAGRTWVAVNAIQYPGNLGTIMRTLDSVGGEGIILLGQATDPYDPGTVKASTGAVFTLKLVRADLESFARWKRQSGAYLVAADVSAPASYRETRYQTPTVLLLGAERDGLTPEQKALCDQLVSIPMVGKADSLNLAVAAGIVLYEIFHQTQKVL